MYYDHEQREKKEDREIIHVPMPTACWDYRPEMEAYLRGRELSFELALANGWYPTISRGQRIVIPCTNSAGFNYWQARSIDGHPLRYDSPAIPRKDSIVVLWPKLHAVFTTVVICEGPMDALAAAAEYPAIAVMGGKPSEEVVSIITKRVDELGFTKVVVVPDKDNLEFISYFTSLISVAKLGLLVPTHKDLAAMPLWERAKLLNTI